MTGKFLRPCLAFVIASLAYAAAWLIGGMIMNFMMTFAILLPSIDRIQTVVSASALAANGAGIIVFAVIAENGKLSIAFSVWLTVVAAAYLTVCLIGGDFHLLWYPILSFIINGVAIKGYLDDISKANSDKSLPL